MLEPPKRYNAKKSSYIQVQRVFRIPTNAAAAHTRAIFEDGVLRVTIPKMAIPTAMPVDEPTPDNVLRFKTH